MFGGLLVLALLGALVAPYFIDWTAYRADFEREASKILGREVTVKGAASARLLPFPSVTFDEVEVKGPEGEALLTVDRFRMDAELAPYLSGEIFIYSMALERPTVRLPIRADESIRWVVDNPEIPTGATVVLENVVIEDGTVIIDDESIGRTKTLLDIDATLSAESLAGPVDGTGSFTVDGQRVVFDVRTGLPQDDGSMPVRVTAANDALDTRIILDGTATAANSVPGFAGSFGLIRPVPDQVLDAQAEEQANPFDSLDPQERGQPSMTEAEPAVAPLRAGGNIRLTADRAEVSELRMQAGGGTQPYILTGSGSLDYGAEPSFALELEGEQVNVDALNAEEEALPPGAVAKDDPDAERLGLSRRIEAMRAVLADVPRPTIDGTIALSLPVVTAGDTTIRDVALVARPQPTGWRLDSFAAELPGRTRIEAAGDVGLDKDFEFSGRLLVASQQPSGFSDWLTGTIDPAVRTLSRAGFSAQTTLSPDRQIFENLEVDVGGDEISGQIARVRAEDHTKITADLQGERVDLDAVLALSRLFTGRDDSLAEADRFDIALDAGPITFADAAADSVNADLSFDGGTLTVDELVIEGLAGARVTSSGTLSDLDGGDAKGRLKVALESQDPDRFFDFLRRVRPGIPLIEVLAERANRLSPLDLSGEVEAVEGEDGKRPTLLVRMRGTADGTRIDMSSAIENGIYARTESGRFGLDLQLKNDRPTVLLGQLGISAVDVSPPSPLEAELSLSAAETGPAVTSATLRAPGNEVSVDGVLEVTPGGVTGADLSVYVNSDDAGPWLRALAVDLGQSFDIVPVSVSGGLIYQDGGWHLPDLGGTIADVSLSAALDKRPEEPLGGNVHVSELSLPWVANLVYGRPLLDVAGMVDWSSESFRPALLPPVEAALNLTADRMTLGATALSDVSADLALSGSEVSLSAMKAQYDGAPLTARATLRNTGGLGGFSLVALAQDIDLAGLFPAAASSDDPAQMSGEIRLESSGQSYQALVSATTGAGSVTVRGIKLPGVGQNTLQPLLAAADSEDFRPQAETAETFRTISKGRAFPVEEAETEFTVAGGTIRFAPVTLDEGDTQLTIDASLDLSDLGLDGDMRLAIDPGVDRVEGAEPVVNYALAGRLSQPELQLDATGLTNYLSVRALEREQARVEAMQESLEEKLRLRREARFYRWRETVAAERARAAEERRQAEEQAAAQRAAEEQARRDEAEAAKRRAQQAANRENAAQRRNQPTPEPSRNGSGGSPATLNFDPPPAADGGTNKEFPSLPGVSNPLEF
nr:AsmA-like C-terminal region-containing protein [Jiella sp. LLJ827]